MIEGAVQDNTPFFPYLAHTAPHWPLHAHPEDIAHYDGVYAKGWDAIRTARHETMNGMGVFQTQWDISPRDQDVHRWNDEAHSDWEAAKMATYAAMVDRMDQSIGTLVATLRRMGQLDNTLFLFLSDNGGCAEFMAEDGWAQFYPDVTHDGRKITMGNIPGLAPGAHRPFKATTNPGPTYRTRPFACSNTMCTRAETRPCWWRIGQTGFHHKPPAMHRAMFSPSSPRYSRLPWRPI